MQRTDGARNFATPKPTKGAPMSNVQTQEEVVADYRTYHIWLKNHFLLTLACDSEGHLLNSGIMVTNDLATRAVQDACQIVLEEIGVEDGKAILSQVFDGRELFTRALTSLVEHEIGTGEDVQHLIEVGL
jgi:hypothetical protein